MKEHKIKQKHKIPHQSELGWCNFKVMSTQELKGLEICLWWCILCKLVLHSSCEAAPGLLRPVLVPTSENGCSLTRQGPRESHKSDQRAGEPALRGKTEGPKSFLREERGLSGELITELYSTSFRMTTKMTEAPLHEEPWKEDKWQWVRAKVGKALSGL